MLQLWSQFAPNKFRSGFRIVPINLRPRSRGRVLLRSRNPFQDPAIQLRLFSDPWDLAVLREGGLIADKVRDCVLGLVCWCAGVIVARCQFREFRLFIFQTRVCNLDAFGTCVTPNTEVIQ